MVKVSIPDDHPPVLVDSPVINRLRSHPDTEVVIWNSLPKDDRELRRRLEGAEIVLNVRASSPFNRHVIESSPDLQHIAIWGTGTDNVDLNAARRQGIIVTHTPDTGTAAVAEHALALLMALARKVPELDARVRKGDWPRGLLTQLAGNTLGVVGTGAVGKRMAEISQGIGMQVVAWTRRPDEAWATERGIRYVEFEEVLEGSDAISLHLRLSEETRGIIGAEAFFRMKPTALLVNIARGGLINEEALADALEEGAIGGAALDTFVREPLHPKSRLRELPNVILSPHTAGTTAEALSAGLEAVIANVLSHLGGEIRHRVA